MSRFTVKHYLDSMRTRGFLNVTVANNAAWHFVMASRVLHFTFHIDVEYQHAAFYGIFSGTNICLRWGGVGTWSKLLDTTFKGICVYVYGQDINWPLVRITFITNYKMLDIVNGQPTIMEFNCLTGEIAQVMTWLKLISLFVIF